MKNTDEAALNAPPATVYLVASLIIVHILLTVASPETVNWAYGAFAFNVGQFTTLLEAPSVAGLAGAVLNLTSHIFLHHDFMHLLINAFMLLAFGSMVERSYGMFGLFVLFIICGWVGALSEYLVSSTNPDAVLYGASGAVLGMMGATARLMASRMGLQKAFAFAGVIMGLNLVIGLTPLGSMLAGEGATISWAAHLGGFVCGVVLSGFLRRRDFLPNA